MYVTMKPLPASDLITCYQHFHTHSKQRKVMQLHHWPKLRQNWPIRGQEHTCHNSDWIRARQMSHTIGLARCPSLTKAHRAREGDRHVVSSFKQFWYCPRPWNCGGYIPHRRIFWVSNAAGGVISPSVPPTTKANVAIWLNQEVSVGYSSNSQSEHLIMMTDGTKPCLQLQ